MENLFMAEEPVTKWWAVGATEESTVRKYVSFLYKHAMFGGHVGLPQDIRNENPNRSLDSTRGMYDMLEVYAVPSTTCLVGTVVNFMPDTGINPDGITYVYPCEDVTKPLGYMIVKASPDAYGICVVSGILEVPLNYEKGSTIPESEYRDYVEYDLDSALFKFSDTGYPVYNVYQDVDGDWIAIILWGKGAGVGSGNGAEYNGPFAVSVDHYDEEVPNKMWINCKDGDVIINQIFRRTCAGFEYIAPDTEQNETDELLGNVSLSTGESLWLGVSYIEVTEEDVTYDDLEFFFVTTTGTPWDTSGTSYFRIAENNEDEGLIQIQYGDIRYNRFRAGENIIIERERTNYAIKISAPYRGPFDVEVSDIEPVTNNNNEVTGFSGKIGIFDSSYVIPLVLHPYAGKIVVGASQTKVYGEQELPFTIENDTSADVYIYEDEGSYSYAIIGRNDTQSLQDLQGKFYTRLATFNISGFVLQIQHGDIVQRKDDSGQSGEDLQDLVVTPGVVGATVSITSGETSAKFKGDGNVDVTTIRRYATSAERTQWGERSAGIAGSTSTALKGAGWRGIYHAYDGSAMTEVSESATFSWQGRTVEVEYPLIVPTTTDAEIDIISRYVSGLRSDVTVNISRPAVATPST